MQYTDGQPSEPWHISTHIPLDEDLIRCPNLCKYLTGDELSSLGSQVVNDFDRDRQSRYEWEQKMDNALKLALQVTEMKTFPWEGAANVKFPLITIAAMQYQSRAYPALINGPRPVACAPFTPRPTMRLPPGLAQQAQQDPHAQQQLQQVVQQAQQTLSKWQQQDDLAARISDHMSFQILEEDETWEENHDKALLIQCLIGCVFKKTYFDPILGHNRSECVNPRDLVVNYYAKSIEEAARLTQVIYLSSNDCYERVQRGVFEEFKEGSPQPEPQLSYSFNGEANERQGTVQQPGDHQAPYECLEQHTYLDLDGDGYAEPYVVTVRYDTRQVLRIVARFTRADITFTPRGKVIRIDPITAYTKYPFIPSPDGGFYDLGFGALLGPINETIDSAINQLLDSGTLACAGGGFLGRGFRNKKGEYRFKPGEWHTVDSTGDDLRKSVLPLPVPQPSNVLFSLLDLLIQYGEAIAGAVDILQGKNPGQNTPAETSRAMVEQGMKVFNGIYKRTHRAFTQELRKLFRLNKIFLTEDSPYYVNVRETYDPNVHKYYQHKGLIVRPSADPFYMSDAQRYNQATSLLAAAHQSPGYDLYEVNKYYLEALKCPHIDRFLPDPKGPFAVPPMPNPKLQIEQIKAQGQQAKLQLDFKLKLLDLVQKAEHIAAQVIELQAKAEFEKAQAAGVADGHRIALIEAQIGAQKAKQEGLLEAIKLMHEVMGGGEGEQGSDTGGVPGMAGASGNATGQGPSAGPAGGPQGPLGGGALPK
jgi:chaperonin GroES